MSDNTYDCRQCGVKVLVAQPMRAAQGKQCPIHGLCSQCAGTACQATHEGHPCGRPKQPEALTCGNELCAVWAINNRRVPTYEQRQQEGRVN